MKSFISEDDIEQAICEHLSQPEFGWKRIECDPSVAAQDDVSKTGRANPSALGDWYLFHKYAFIGLVPM